MQRAAAETGLADATSGPDRQFAGQHHLGRVDDFAHPLPVTAIGQLSGVPPRKPAALLRTAGASIETVDPTTGPFAEASTRETTPARPDEAERVGQSRVTPPIRQRLM